MINIIANIKRGKLIHGRSIWLWGYHLNQVFYSVAVAIFTDIVIIITTLQCDILALVWLFGPANVTFWTCQCDFSALRLFPAMSKFIWLPDAQMLRPNIGLDLFERKYCLLFSGDVCSKINEPFWSKWLTIHAGCLGLVGDIWSYKYAY